MLRRRFSGIASLCILLIAPYGISQAQSIVIIGFNAASERAAIIVSDAGPGAADAAATSPREVSAEIIGPDGSVVATLPAFSLTRAGFKRWTFHVEPADAGYQTGVLHVDHVAVSLPLPIVGGRGEFGVRLICETPCPGGVGVSGVVSDRSTGGTRAKYELKRVLVSSYSVSGGGD